MRIQPLTLARVTSAILVATVVADAPSACAATAAAEVVWEAPLTDCSPADIVVDGSGSSYVTCHALTGAAAVVRAYSTTGALLATRSFTTTTARFLRTQDLALGTNALYVAYTEGGDTFSAVLAALDPATLAVQWTRPLGGFTPNSLAIATDGNIWLVGNDAHTTTDIAAFRFSPAGVKLGEAHIDRGEDDALGFEGKSAAPAPAGGLYIGGFDAVFRVDTNGSVVWSSPVASTAIKADAAGRLYVTNMREPTGNTYRFSADGRTEWHTTRGGGAIAVAADGSAWIAGTKANTRGRLWDLEASLLRADGAVAFVDRYDGGNHDRGVDVAVDASGTAYVLGSSFVSGNEKYLILKYTATSRRIWAFAYGRSGLPAALAILPDGRPVATGYDGTIALRDRAASTPAPTCPWWLPRCWGR